MFEQEIKSERTLYFDIDGTINDYNDVVKSRFRNGQLQQLLEELGFKSLVCVSGWATMVRDAGAYQSWRQLSNDDMVEAVREVILDAFPDREIFHSACELRFENDDRCNHIDTSKDWYYLDDWANEFAAKRWAETMPDEFLTRICQCAPRGDGGDIIDFLQGAVMENH